MLKSAIITKKVDSTYLIISLFKRANEKDEVSMNILKTVGENMAHSTAGAIVRTTLPDPTYVILAGSVWANATNKIMIVSFINKVNELKLDEDPNVILVKINNYEVCMAKNSLNPLFHANACFNFLAFSRIPFSS